MLKFVISFIIAFFLLSFSNAETKTDSVKKHVNTLDYSYKGFKGVDTSLLKELRSNVEFNYRIEKPNESGFLRWLFQKIGKFFSSLFKHKATPYIIYILFGALFLFLVLKLFDKKVQAIFIPSKNKRINSSVNEIDISAPDYENLIAESAKNQDFQAAVRFMYLKFLQELNNRKIIIWKADKTTIDYLLEIQHRSLNAEFVVLSGMYEYVWYGKFTINSVQCDVIQKRFDETYRILNVKS